MNVYCCAKDSKVATFAYGGKPRGPVLFVRRKEAVDFCRKVGGDGYEATVVDDVAALVNEFGAGRYAWTCKVSGDRCNVRMFDLQKVLTELGGGPT